MHQEEGFAAKRSSRMHQANPLDVNAFIPAVSENRQLRSAIQIYSDEIEKNLRIVPGVTSRGAGRRHFRLNRKA
jgi:hypothetical protein